MVTAWQISRCVERIGRLQLICRSVLCWFSSFFLQCWDVFFLFVGLGVGNLPEAESTEQMVILKDKARFLLDTA